MFLRPGIREAARDIGITRLARRTQQIALLPISLALPAYARQVAEHELIFKISAIHFASTVDSL